jgi:hypothetical protein
MGGLSKLLLLCFCSLLSAFAERCPQPSSSATPDRLLFQNGDVLTGQVLAINNDSIRFHNSALGELAVPWTAVVQVESHNHAIAPLTVGAVPRTSIAFQTALFTRSKDVVIVQLDNGQPRLELAALTLTKSVCDEAAQTPPSKTAPAKTGFISRWFLSVNAPESLAYGTASQQILGGSMTLELYEGSSNHTRLSATGSHNRSWQIGSSSVTTDALDAFLQQGRSFGPNRGGIYGKAETFLNTSLGLASEDSFGGGYYSPSFTRGSFQLKWLADLRYFRERLYGIVTPLNLVGSRFEGNMIFRKADSHDKTKTKYTVILDTWINPMWNNESALQGFATVNINFPLGRSVCLSFNPIEDDYLRNPPAGNRRNYATSYVTLAIQHGSNPNQRCY